MTSVSPRGRRPKNKAKLLTKLLSNMERGLGCWLWKGAPGGRDGRGSIKFCGKNYLVTRLLYTLLKQEIPEGLCILHKCDAPLCCKPSHLFLGTQSDNMLDAFQKGRKTNKGEKNPKAKIDPDIVREIRKRYPIEGGVSLAKEFGLDRTQPYRIYNRITWGDVK